MELLRVHEKSGSQHVRTHPEPTFSFTIPSIHDGTTLECRIYHPPYPILKKHEHARGRFSVGAIMSHPYASFGGCYDDNG